MKNYVFLLISVLFFSNSCKEENDCCAQVPGNDELFEFSLKSTEGTDLLDPDAVGSFNTAHISVFELREGEFLEINNPNLDASKGYTIFQHDDGYRIRLFIEAGVDRGDYIEKTAIIKWGDLGQDTIQLHLISESKNILRLTEIRYNDEVVWDSTDSLTDVRYFEIVK